MTEPTTHLLIVDDEAALRNVIAERLTEQGFAVTEAESGEKALALLNEFAFDIVISDLRLPGIDGHHVIEAALERYPGIIAIVVTGFGTVKNAVDAIKRGATDFVAKPFQFDELLHVLRSALEQRRLKNENAYLRQQLDERFGLGAIIGQSPRMRELFQLIETIAPTGDDDPDQRRDRHGQGDGRARDSSDEPAAPAAFRRAQLQRDSRDAARSGALRPRARRVHRRRRIASGAHRAGRRRHALPRRSRDDGDVAADEAAARAAGARVRARRRRQAGQGRRARRRGDEFRSRRRWSRTARSARICITG